MTYFLETERLGLRCLLLEDIYGNYGEWFNDPEVCKYNAHHRYPMTEQELKGYVNDVSVSNRSLVLAIIEKSAKKHIGNISLQEINYIDRSAEFAIIMGEKDVWGKGYASEAGKALIQHAFHSLNLHRVYVGTASNNIGMQKLALKLGFEQEGIRREALYNKGNYYDIIEYGMLRLDYDSRTESLHEEP